MYFYKLYGSQNALFVLTRTLCKIDDSFKHCYKLILKLILTNTLRIVYVISVDDTQEYASLKRVAIRNYSYKKTSCYSIE